MVCGTQSEDKKWRSDTVLTATNSEYVHLSGLSWALHNNQHPGNGYSRTGQKKRSPTEWPSLHILSTLQGGNKIISETLRRVRRGAITGALKQPQNKIKRTTVVTASRKVTIL